MDTALDQSVGKVLKNQLTLGPVSQNSRNSSGLYFGCHNSLYIFGNAYVKNTLKDQLFKTRGLEFGNWFFRPEKFSELSFEKQAPVFNKARPNGSNMLDDVGSVWPGLKRQADLIYVQLINA